MKTVYRLTIALIAIATIFAIMACKSDPDPFWEISNIYWRIGNIDPGNSNNDASAYLFMSIYFDNPGPMSSDIESFRISAPNGTYWFFDQKKGIDFRTTDAGKKYIERPWLYSDHISYNGSVLPAGTYVVNVKYKNGKFDRSSFLVPEPGSTTTNGKEFVYTEDYYSYYDPPASHAALPSRATIVSAVYTGASSEITIEFTVQDDIIYNGVVWFYDSADEYIGASPLFRDSKTKQINTVLNKGNSFHIDNNKNTVVLTEDNIKFEDGKSMNDIAQLRLELRDGKQYASLGDASHDTYSLTASYSLTKE